MVTDYGDYGHSVYYFGCAHKVDTEFIFYNFCATLLHIHDCEDFSGYNRFTQTFLVMHILKATLRFACTLYMTQRVKLIKGYRMDNSIPPNYSGKSAVTRIHPPTSLLAKSSYLSEKNFFSLPLEESCTFSEFQPRCVIFRTPGCSLETVKIIFLSPLI